MADEHPAPVPTPPPEHPPAAEEPPTAIKEEVVVVKDVAVKDVVMVCDCGGGTVDVTSYEITEVTPMLEFEEVVEGIGGKCGSTYIDREFHRWMSDTFGSSFDELKFERIGPGSYFMKDFEMYKRDFGSDSDLDREYEIRLNMPDAGDSELYDADESTVKLTG